MKADEYQRMFQVEATHWWYAGMREIQRAILQSIPDEIPESPRVLDAGCGTGFNLVELGQGAVGVDASEEALRFCRARGAENTLCADIARLPFDDASFDRVISFDVLSDRGVEDDRRATRELGRVLRPGGLLIVRVPALPLLRRAHDEHVDTRERYSRSGLVNLLEAAGLQVLRITYCNAILLPLVALRALSDRYRGDGEQRSDLASLPRPIETLFRRCLLAEARLLRRRDLPLGTSLVAIARKLD